MDDKARRLWLSYVAMDSWRTAWEESVANAYMTQGEKDALYEAYTRAENDLDDVMNEIRQLQLFTVYTVNEARHFLLLLPDFMRNPGELTGVWIGTEEDVENVTAIRGMLEAAGLRLVAANLIFELPPVA